MARTWAGRTKEPFRTGQTGCGRSRRHMGTGWPCLCVRLPLCRNSRADTEEWAGQHTRSQGMKWRLQAEEEQSAGGGVRRVIDPELPRRTQFRGRQWARPGAEQGYLGRVGGRDRAEKTSGTTLTTVKVAESAPGPRAGRGRGEPTSRELDRNEK